MAFTIKPLLGQGTLTVYSVFDEAIDWKATEKNGGPTEDQYIANPWPFLMPENKLVFHPEKQPSPIHCRTPSELDLEAVDSSRLLRTESGAQQVRHPRKENLHLFRRCARSIDNYTIDGEPLSFEPWEKDADGTDLVSKDACAKIPFPIRAEIGEYLKQSQEVSDELKNA